MRPRQSRISISPRPVWLLSLALLVPGTIHADLLLPARPDRIELVEPLDENRGPGKVGIRPRPQAYERLLRAGSALVTGFPLPDGTLLDLELVSRDISTTRFFVGNGNGGIRSSAGPEGRLFRGRVAGDPGSLVSLNLIGGHLAGFIRTGDREYSFGPRSFARGRNEDSEEEVRDDEAGDGSSWLCDGDDSHAAAPLDPYSSLRQGPGGSTALAGIDNDTLLVAKIAVEGTVEWVNKHGGVAAAQAYTLNLMAQVSAVYEAEVKVQIDVPYILMNAAEPDGYTGTSNSTSTILSEMRAKWNGNQALRDVFRSAVHVFGTYPSGGAGRAYIDVLCSNVPANPSSYDYGVSLIDGNGGSWERRMVAHEIGHNFSSYHSHCYSPEIDQCYNLESGCYAGSEVQTTGTIMSYCDVRMTTFHQRTIDEMLRPSAEAAYPACLDVAGSPGGLGMDEASALIIDSAPICGSETLQTDDGSGTAAYGYSGTALAAWVKRLTPGCYPFKLEGVEVRFSNASTVAPGRPVRILVYSDSAGTGDPANATLVHSEDTTVQVVSSSLMNQYTLSSSVIVGSGDLYLGFQDLLADTTTSYIMDFDSSISGDSWWQANGTTPEDFSPFSGAGTWMIRGLGGGVDAGSIVLTWGQPCNGLSVPNQDFAIYQGMIGDWENLSSVTCSTGRATSWFIENAPDAAFWIVVPQTSTSEGSYGLATAGERFPAAAACKPQEIGVCQ